MTAVAGRPQARIHGNDPQRHRPVGVAKAAMERPPAQELIRLAIGRTNDHDPVRLNGGHIDQVAAFIDGQAIRFLAVVQVNHFAYRGSI